MLFINLDIIIELMGYNIHKCNKENKILYYNDISNTTLEEDITFTTNEINLLNDICELEIYNASLIGKRVNENIRGVYHFSELEEREFFTKLFVRDYLSKQDSREELLLENYLVENGLFSTVAVVEAKNRLTAIKLFEDFASKELKSDKEFAKVILQLDGSYILAMGQNVKDSASTMEIAIKNDKTRDVVSFVNSNSKLLSNPDLAILYFKKLKENMENDFSVQQVYETIFKQENGEYPKNIFKKGEQAVWLEDSNFLPRLAKLDKKFVEFICDGSISKTSKTDSKKMIKTDVK